MRDHLYIYIYIYIYSFYMPRIIRKWLSCHGQLPGALALPQRIYCGSSMPHILATNVAHPLISPLLHSLHTPSSLATPPNLPVSIWNAAVPCTSQFHHHPSVSCSSKPCTICPFLQIVYFVFFIVPVYMCTNMYVCLLTASPVDPHGMLLV